MIPVLLSDKSDSSVLWPFPLRATLRARFFGFVLFSLGQREQWAKLSAVAWIVFLAVMVAVLLGLWTGRLVP